MAADQHQQDERRWRGRPILGAALQAVIAVVPLLLGVGAGFLVTRVVAPGRIDGPWLTWLVAAATATLVILMTQPLLRRLLPLAWLLRLGMLWPGRAPSRFELARRAGRMENLEGQLARASERGLDGDPTEAAETVLSLVTALTAHDRRTRGHAERVRIFTDLLAVELGLDGDDRDRLRWASLLHDIGKLEVPETVLNKPGKPSPSEWEQLKAHPAAGDRILAPLREWLGPWADATLHHHERWDGKGYPGGLAGTEISYAGRIVSVADAYEVMTAARAYKRPMGALKAREELVACAGGQFDPAVVRAFLLIPLSRLRWALGPFSWVAQLPVARDVVHASSSMTAAQVSTAAGAAASAAAIGLGQLAGQVPALAAVGPPLGPDRPETEEATERNDAESAAGSLDRRFDEVGTIRRPSDDTDETRDDATSDDPPPEEPARPDPGGDSGEGSGDTGGDSNGEDTGDDGGVLGGVIDSTLAAVDDAGSDLGDAVDDTTGTIGDVTRDVGGAVGGPVGDTVGDLGDAVDDTGGALGDAVDDTTESVTDVGRDLLGH